MKILIANIVYNDESTGKIVKIQKKFLESKDYKVSVAYGIRGNYEDAEVHKVCNDYEIKLCYLLNLLGRQRYKGAFWGTKKMIQLIKHENPDIVHLHCMNSYCVDLYMLLMYLAANSIKTVVTHHAEFYYTGACSYAFDCMNWSDEQCRNCPRPKNATNSRIFADPHRDWMDMYKAFSSFSQDKLVFTSVSPWVQNRALMSPIVNRYKHITVLNGVDCNVFSYKPNRSLLSNRIENLSAKIVLHVAAHYIPQDKNHIKGGWYVNELAKKHPKITFVVVAGTVENTDVLPRNVFVWGRATDSVELAQLYSSADVTLLTSKRETFSMVTAESLCCGTPVVGFEAGGPESIALTDYSDFVEYGDIDSLDMALMNRLNMKTDKLACSNEAHKKYSEEAMAQGYLDVYNSFK